MNDRIVVQVQEHIQILIDRVLAQEGRLAAHLKFVSWLSMVLKAAVDPRIFDEIQSMLLKESAECEAQSEQKSADYSMRAALKAASSEFKAISEAILAG